MKAIKLLTQVKTYLPSIYRALAKYACNLYSKCTSQVLKQNFLLSGNSILINTCLSSAFYATGFDLASGFHRVQSMKSRCQVDENSSGRRKWLEEKVKKSSPETGIPLETYTNALKIGTNAHPLDHFFNTCYIPAFNHLRTLFYLSQSLHHMCAVPFPSLHQEMDGAGVLEVLCSYRETYYKVKRRLKESPNKVRTYGFAFVMIFMKNVFAEIILKVRSVYTLFTIALLKWHRKGTGDVLESYQIGTNGSSLSEDIQRANGQASVFTPFQRRALSQTKRFKGFTSSRDIFVWFCNNNPFNRLKFLLNLAQEGLVYVINIGVVYKELKAVRAMLLLTLTVFQNFNFSLTVLKSIRTYSLLVLMFHMFSLSAQTPRKDSGADGLVKIQALKIGDSIPEAVWSMPLQIVNHPEGKDTITLNDYRDKKLIVLDFWAIWCAPCIKSIIHIDSLITELDSDRVALLPINRYDNKARMQSFIDKVDWPFPSVINNKMLDEILMSSYRDYLGVVWILDQKLFAVPRKESITIENLESLLCDQYDNLNLVNYPPIIRTKQ